MPDRALALIFLLGVLSYCESSAADIMGLFQDKDNKPVPGALIAVYNADTGLLIDYTYSQDKGNFILKSPQLTGRYYIVATKDRLSQKDDPFTYDPGEQKNKNNIIIRYQKVENRFVEIFEYLWEKFGHVISGILGALFTFWYKNRKMKIDAKSSLKLFISEMAPYKENIVHGAETLNQLIESYDSISPGDTPDKFKTSATKIIDKGKELENNLQKYNIYQATDKLNQTKREEIIENYHNLKKSVSDVNDFVIFINNHTDTELRKLHDQSKEERLKLFNHLEDNPLWKMLRQR